MILLLIYKIKYYIMKFKTMKDRADYYEAKLREEQKNKAEQIAMRERKYDELKEKNNQLYNENTKLQSRITELENQSVVEPKRNYQINIWYQGEIDTRFIDQMFVSMCLEKVNGPSAYDANSLSYILESTESARRLFTRTATEFLRTLFPDSNIQVSAKAL